MQSLNVLEYLVKVTLLEHMPDPAGPVLTALRTHVSFAKVATTMGTIRTSIVSLPYNAHAT